jgi:lipopolysaccharide biosynthesis regulator YciM
MGALLILKGDYKGAVAALNGANSYNEALANVLTNNLSKASSILANAKCACKSYLKAIIAARQGNNSQAKELLEVAKKDEKLAKRAANDIEFAKL